MAKILRNGPDKEVLALMEFLRDPLPVKENMVWLAPAVQSHALGSGGQRTPLMWSNGTQTWRYDPGCRDGIDTMEHNPAGLSKKRVGDGWRLLTVAEVEEGSAGLRMYVEKWDGAGHWLNSNGQGYVGSMRSETYRAKFRRKIRKRSDATWTR